MALDEIVPLNETKLCNTLNSQFGELLSNYKSPNLRLHDYTGMTADGTYERTKTSVHSHYEPCFSVLLSESTLIVSIWKLVSLIGIQLCLLGLCYTFQRYRQEGHNRNYIKERSKIKVVLTPRYTKTKLWCRTLHRPLTPQAQDFSELISVS